jgi:hypothetical protein
MKKRKIRKVEKKLKKKRKKKEKKKKRKKRKESQWITVVIHSEMCVGDSDSPTRFSILVNVLATFYFLKYILYL